LLSTFARGNDGSTPSEDSTDIVYGSKDGKKVGADIGLAQDALGRISRYYRIS
jgi:hypothetical protein